MSGAIETVALEKVKPSKQNIRENLGELAELAASIKTQGIIAPLVVVPEGGGYEVVAGNRRLAAAKLAKLTTIPVIVRTDLDEKGRMEVQLIENLQREDISPIEEGRAYASLIEVTGYSQRELATRIGRSQALISKRMALLNLAPSIQTDVAKGKVNLGDAEEVSRLSNAQDQKDVLDAVRADPLMTVRSAVDRREAEAKRVAKVQEAQDKAKKAGLRIVPFGDVETGLVSYVEDTDEYDGVGMTAAQHKKEPCHAVSIDSAGRTIPVCLNPENHIAPVVDLSDGKKANAKADAKADGKAPAKVAKVEPEQPVETPEEAKERRARERAEAHEKALRASRRDREEFIAGLVVGRPPAKAEVTSYVFWAFIERAGATETKDAVDYLGLDVPEVSESWQASGASAKVLKEYAAKNGDNLQRAGYALALAYSEVQVGGSSSWERWEDDPQAQRHFRHLEDRGYALSGAEAKQLGKKAPPAKKVTAKATSK